MYKFPVIELVDRYCIAKLKFEKIGDNKEELDFYTEQLRDINFDLIKEELDLSETEQSPVPLIAKEKKEPVDDKFFAYKKKYGFVFFVISSITALVTFKFNKLYYSQFFGFGSRTADRPFRVNRLAGFNRGLGWRVV